MFLLEGPAQAELASILVTHHSTGAIMMPKCKTEEHQVPLSFTRGNKMGYWSKLGSSFPLEITQLQISLAPLVKT